MVLVDTSVWIDYFNDKDAPHTRLLDRILDEDRVCTGDLILTELLQGFRSEKDLVTARKIMETFEYRDLVGKEIALKASENYRNLRSKGITVRKTIDVLIGTFCIHNNIRLLHNDRDFDPMESLGLETVK